MLMPRFVEAFVGALAGRTAIGAKPSGLPSAPLTIAAIIEHPNLPARPEGLARKCRGYPQQVARQSASPPTMALCHITMIMRPDVAARAQAAKSPMFEIRSQRRASGRHKSNETLLEENRRLARRAAESECTQGETIYLYRKQRMQDTAKHRAEIIDHLEKALTLCDAAAVPVVGYLIERALDEARATDWTQNAPRR